MEIKWLDIIDLKVNYCPESGLGTLDIVLARPPLFFIETEPQPRKPTIWKPTTDFTEGQASMNRRHFLQCPSELLSKDFEKLIQCDKHLNWLSQQPELVLESPYFETKGSVSGISQELLSWRETSTPSLVMDNNSHAIEENGSMSSDAGQSKLGLLGHWDDQFKVPGIQPSMSTSDLVVMSHMGHCVSEPMTSANPNPLFFVEGTENRDMLEEITQYLLSDTQQNPSATSDEKSIMSRVNSLCTLLQIDPTTMQNSQVNAEEEETQVGKLTPPMSARREGDDFNESIESKPGMSRKDSLEELLFNLPRIASLPQLLYNISEDGDDYLPS
ncbi:hypothetical protein BVC80_1835g106 [Macleaya cordata]|uniref:TRF2/HOY1 PH-like domain-containing protein n=1 Tax=Macleaya cordata TaxID=56857 RepID=A0A200R4Y0_MACCD|nr:hypothetical protein BVC80_1835g106 [Macleaya cordata]